MIMKKTILSILLALVAMVAGAYTVKEIPNVHVQDRTRYVSNPDGILSLEAQTRADSIVAGIWRASTAEVAVAIVDQIDGSDINTFATDLFTEWGLGKKDNDNGLLVLIVKGERKAVLRTGYGMEGVIPDVYASRIIRNDMAPYFKQNDYDAGTLAALNTISTLITDPEAARELQSKYENDQLSIGLNGEEMFGYYKMFCVAVLIGMFLCYFVVLANNKSKNAPEKYQNMHKFKIVALIASFIGLGMPLVVFLLAWWSERRIRTKNRRCPNCKTKMTRLSEDEDNKYLTAAQDLEERLDSVDYDVWLCSKCGETDVLPFVNTSKSLSVCSNCGARTNALTANRIIVNATTSREGRGVKIYTCRNCHRTTEVPYKIPKEEVPVAPIIIGGMGGRGGGGGFSGGSFGGGFTGGGGASGGW